jgi:hypothetical protein
VNDPSLNFCDDADAFFLNFCDDANAFFFHPLGSTSTSHLQPLVELPIAVVPQNTPAASSPNHLRQVLWRRSL